MNNPPFRIGPFRIFMYHTLQTPIPRPRSSFSRAGDPIISSFTLGSIYYSAQRCQPFFELHRFSLSLSQLTWPRAGN